MAHFTGQLFGGGWTERKLEILKEYFHSYNKALKKQPFRRVYIDAFAGTGYREKRKAQYEVPDLFEEFSGGESEQLLKGSAKLALEADPPFNEFVFIESDQNKIEELDKLREQHPDKASNVEIIQGDANLYVQDYCKMQDWKVRRAVLFLDPFATDVAWETVEAIAQTRAIDVWIWFPLMAINRLLAHDAKKVWQGCLNRIFGTNQWFGAFYKTQTLDDIFGQSVDTIVKACDFSMIADFYKERLKAIFAGVADNPKVFYNSRNGALFQLFFAAANPRGAKVAIPIAEHLLEKMWGWNQR